MSISLLLEMAVSGGPDSMALLHYFTLPMALNYQRNSYKLWPAATAAFEDRQTAWLFTPADVVQRSVEDLRDALVRHKVALQPVNHVKIWRTLCETFVRDFDGDARNLLRHCGGDIGAVKAYIAVHKKDFPYLGGPKICNYWLYVLTQYMDLGLHNRAALSIAPDTHVMQASQRLGVADSATPEATAASWAEALEGTSLAPIDVHTPLWLWSRAGFPAF